MTEIEASREIRDRATALYTFLKEFTELRSKTNRTVDQYDMVLWFSDLPREPECECAAWNRGQDASSTEVWLTIHQPRLTPAPVPPSVLEPWLIRDQVTDSSIEVPDLRPEASVSKQSPSGEQRFERRMLVDCPEIKSTWERYVESQWRPWAVADRRAQSVQRVYTQLFSIYQKQQRLGEQYEVILGLGLLSWRTPDSQEVRRHLIAANATVSFDSVRGIMSVGPAGEGAKPQIEQDMVDPVQRPEPLELRALENQVADLADEIWEPVPIDAILSGWVRSASPRGTYDDSLLPPEAISSDPKVSLAPALILRKRTERSYLRAFEEIITQLKSGAPIPPGVGRFVTVTEDPQPAEANAAPEIIVDEDIGEVYFPLEWNEAQRQIVERLSKNQGVLVQGPPGTGKSHTIANLICHLLASGKRVLVTSHTARALKVLQRFLRTRMPDISPLAVVLLGNDRDALQAMEDSVQGITNRHNHWDPSANTRRIKDLEGRLDEARREEALVLSALRAIRERETYLHPVRFGGYSGSLQSIAARLRREEPEFYWMTDRPRDTQKPPLSSTQFQELISLLRDSALNEWQLAGHDALDSNLLPSPESVAHLFVQESFARAAFDDALPARQHSQYLSIFNANQEARQRLVEELHLLLRSIDQIGRHLHTWAERAIREIMGDHDRVWAELLDLTREHLSAIAGRARKADELPISGLADRDHHEVRADAEAMVTHLNGGGNWGLGPFRATAAKRGQYLRQDVKVAGRPADTVESLTSLISWLDVESRLSVLRERWSSTHSINPRSTFSEQTRIFEDLCEPLSAALSLYDRKTTIRGLIQSIPDLSEPTWHDLETLRLLAKCCASVHYEMELRAIQQEHSHTHTRIESAMTAANCDSSGPDLARSFDARDIDGYRNAFALVVANESNSRRLSLRDALLSALRGPAPSLVEQLLATAFRGTWDQRARGFEAAWNWAQARAWLERLCDPAEEQRLLLQLDSARDRIRLRLKEIAGEKAWRHCFARMTEYQRQHLIAWSKAVRSIGKGTGKYAAQHRRNAREHMNECRSAIPAWVMPIYRVAESVRPGSDLFDVVIVDEASQSGPEALLLAYLAKKLIVVGDDKQISPTYAGIDHEDVNHLRTRHLTDVPHADSYGVHQSFFDLAEIRYQGRIRLREHFRCMPEIIQFSNNLCYASEPLIPLRQFGGSRLSPVVSVRHVPDGYLAGSGQSVSNPPEADAIVREIVRMHSDRAYVSKTFGVISLLGQLQAHAIERLLLDRLGPQAMEKHQIVCGDAYAFQGDERDVMLLSLVSAPTDGRRIGTLADEAARRRFNVAASRARDQMLLFHTATLNDLSPQCLRYALLQYCQNPSVEQLALFGRPIAELQHIASTSDRDRASPPEPFGSWFELDVFLRITARGFRVLPQLEAAGYRIDLVVDGMDRRVAVECDGDHWHGPDRYDEDMSRQRMLERCGWKFWRVRGSAFSLDPERAMEALWDTLDRQGIYPDGQHSTGKPGPTAASRASSAPSLDSQLINSPIDISVSPGMQDRTGAESEASNPKPTSFRAPGATPLSPLPDVEGLPTSEVSDDIGRRSAHRGLSVPVPDPTEAQPSELVPGLIEIVAAEGPLSFDRLCHILVKAAGRHRVGRQSRSTIYRAVALAIRASQIEDRRETPDGPLKERILRKAHSPIVVVRPRGNRDLVDIPPSEVATVMQAIEHRGVPLQADEMYRAVLDFYETKRLTANIQRRLHLIFERRLQLCEDKPSVRTLSRATSQEVDQ